VCVYGYAATDNIIEAYCATHSPDDNRGKLYDDRVILRLAARCSLRVSIFRPYGPDNILWFSYSRGGPVQIKKIPTASRLQHFATELGITETAKWHDVSRVCVNMCCPLTWFSCLVFRSRPFPVVLSESLYVVAQPS
jgi:hypothetical protein